LENRVPAQRIAALPCNVLVSDAPKLEGQDNTDI